MRARDATVKGLTLRSHSPGDGRACRGGRWGGCSPLHAHPLARRPLRRPRSHDCALCCALHRPRPAVAPPRYVCAAARAAAASATTCVRLPLPAPRRCRRALLPPLVQQSQLRRTCRRHAPHAPHRDARSSRSFPLLPARPRGAAGSQLGHREQPVGAARGFTPALRPAPAAAGARALPREGPASQPPCGWVKGTADTQVSLPGALRQWGLLRGGGQCARGLWRGAARGRGGDAQEWGATARSAQRAQTWGGWYRGERVRSRRGSAGLLRVLRGAVPPRVRTPLRTRRHLRPWRGCTVITKRRG